MRRTLTTVGDQKNVRGIKTKKGLQYINFSVSYIEERIKKILLEESESSYVNKGGP